MMIVVFDSNVWISAFRFGGGPMQALEAAYRTHTVAFCNEIEAEVERTMLTKFGLSRYHTARLMNRWVDEGIRIKITGNLKNTCRDSSDDVIVECAVLAQADLIVTGDKDLLSLRAYGTIEIVAPADFVKLIASREPQV